MTYKVGRCLLRELLDEKKMTQQELAEKLGVTAQQINKYTTKNLKRRRIMSLQTAVNIAAILQCDVEDLYEIIEVGSNE